MGVAEAGRIFEAEAERAVEADMRRPNQPSGGEGRPPRQQGRCCERDWPYVAVGSVVGRGSSARACCISGDGQVGGEEQDSEQGPAFPELAIKQGSAEQDGQALQPQEQAHPARHRHRARGSSRG